MNGLNLLWHIRWILRKFWKICEDGLKEFDSVINSKREGPREKAKQHLDLWELSSALIFFLVPYYLYRARKPESLFHRPVEWISNKQKSYKEIKEHKAKAHALTDCSEIKIDRIVSRMTSWPRFRILKLIAKMQMELQRDWLETFGIDRTDLART